jgi:hypothetical protein
MQLNHIAKKLRLDAWGSLGYIFRWGIVAGPCLLQPSSNFQNSPLTQIIRSNAVLSTMHFTYTSIASAVIPRDNDCL